MPPGNAPRARGSLDQSPIGRRPWPVRRLLHILRNPVPAERRRLLARRWASLPAWLRGRRQVLGRHWVHCGYTLGPSYCAFGCTHCYLPKNANRVPLPSLAEMRAQIDVHRRLLGPRGNLQITGGDVVDAYQRAERRSELVEVVRHATGAGLVPMLMTHGQGLLEEPALLRRLVREGGLRKLGLHVDMTQAGRPGHPGRALEREADLNPVRDALAALIMRTRAETGAALSAAHTVTVTRRNVESIGDILEWLIGEPRRLDAFHTVSFQTEADVGRTRLPERPVSPDEVWARIGAALGQALPRDGLWFGHPQCTRTATLLVVFPERRLVRLSPASAGELAAWDALLDLFGGVGGGNATRLERAARWSGAALRRPGRLLQVAGHAAGRWRAEGLGWRLPWALARGRARGLNVVMHNFMGRDELATPQSLEVRERLAACSFRGAVRTPGGWEAVPMCSMNAGPREALYAARIASGEDNGAA